MSRLKLLPAFSTYRRCRDIGLYLETLLETLIPKIIYVCVRSIDYKKQPRCLNFKFTFQCVDRTLRHFEPNYRLIEFGYYIKTEESEVYYRTTKSSFKYKWRTYLLTGYEIKDFISVISELGSKVTSSMVKDVQVECSAAIITDPDQIWRQMLNDPHWKESHNKVFPI